MKKASRIVILHIEGDELFSLKRAGARSLLWDNNDDILVLGSFDYPDDPPYKFNDTLSVPAAWSNYYLAKYDSSGNLLWVNSGNSGDMILVFPKIDNSNNIILQIYFIYDSWIYQNGSRLFSAKGGEPDVHLTKLSPEGNLLWHKQLHNDYAGFWRGYLQTFIDDDNSIVCYVDNEGKIINVSDQDTLTNNCEGLYEYVFVKFNKNGEKEWSKNTLLSDLNYENDKILYNNDYFLIEGTNKFVLDNHFVYSREDKFIGNFNKKGDLLWMFPISKNIIDIIPIDDRVVFCEKSKSSIQVFSIDYSEINLIK